MSLDAKSIKLHKKEYNLKTDKFIIMDSMQKESKCYWVQMHIEPFHTQPLKFIKKEWFNWKRDTQQIPVSAPGLVLTLSFALLYQ